MSKDFSSVTERPGSPATREQLARLYHRYHAAARYGRGRRILEAACGAGLGLGYLAGRAESVVGGDFTESLLKTAQTHYRGRVPLVRLDAQLLPFQDRSFDLVVMFEAVYYLDQPERFFAESRRVLSPGGTLLLGTVNKDWAEFTPSLFSTKYFAVPGLRDLLRRSGFTGVEFFGAFPAGTGSPSARLVGLIRRTASALHLVPSTLTGRERLKRLFYGPLRPLPPEVTEDLAAHYPLVPISGDFPNYDYKIIYAAARV